MTTISANPLSESDWRPYTATLVASPFRVPVGSTVTVTGDGYTPGSEVELAWHSVEGRYEAEGLLAFAFVGQRYERTETVVATVVADENGQVAGSFTVPIDFGGPHDIRGRVGGVEVSQGGVSVTPVWSMTPTEGPVGTPIELRVVGIDHRPQVNTWQLLWDNHYFGMMTGVTTRGVGVARIRAAGPAGVHHIAAWNNSHHTAPYLGWDNCPFQDEFAAGLDFQFTVTRDEGVLPPGADDFAAFDNPMDVDNPGPGTLDLAPDRGIVSSKTMLRGAGLPPNARLPLVWCTLVGGGILASAVGDVREWRRPLGEVRTGADGSFTMPFKIPDDRGGNHRIEICRGSDVLAAADFVVLPSLVSYTEQVRAGETVNIHIQGGGYRDYDKTYALTYDNSYIGYSCGGSNSGNLRFRFTATGAPGTHLLDFYPMIYRGRDELPRGVYAMPHLSYADDHPLRKVPAFRLAIEVVE